MKSNKNTEELSEHKRGKADRKRKPNPHHEEISDED